MRPHELFLPQGWAFMFIFIYKGLRVGVRVRVTGPHPKVYPWCHLLDHIITPTMTSFSLWRHNFRGVRVSREANIWFTGHVTPCCMLIGPFVPRDLYLALWLVSAQVTPLTTYIPTIISKCCLFQSQHFYQKDLYTVKKGWTNINFLLIFFLLTSFVFWFPYALFPLMEREKHDCFMVNWVRWLEWIQNLGPSQQVEEED